MKQRKVTTLSDTGKVRPDAVDRGGHAPWFGAASRATTRRSASSTPTIGTVVLRLCQRQLGDPDEADDVTQEAFVRAWRALPSFADDLRFYPWLTVIAKNLCTDRLRRRARHLVAYDVERLGAIDGRFDRFTPTVGSAEETVISSIDDQLAVRALHRLSDRHRRILGLREEKGLSYEEIAAQEGIAMTAVVTLIWRARQALKREFAALEGTKTVGGILSALGALRGLADRLARRAAAAGLERAVCSSARVGNRHRSRHHPQCRGARLLELTAHTEHPLCPGGNRRRGSSSNRPGAVDDADPGHHARAGACRVPSPPGSVGALGCSKQPSRLLSGTPVGRTDDGRTAADLLDDDPSASARSPADRVGTIGDFRPHRTGHPDDQRRGFCALRNIVTHGNVVTHRTDHPDDQRRGFRGSRRHIIGFVRSPTDNLDPAPPGRGRGDVGPRRSDRARLSELGHAPTTRRSG